MKAQNEENQNQDESYLPLKERVKTDQLTEEDKATILSALDALEASQSLKSGGSQSW